MLLTARMGGGRFVLQGHDQFLKEEEILIQPNFLIALQIKMKAIYFGHGLAVVHHR